MDKDTRTALLILGIAFCAAFGVATVFAATQGTPTIGNAMLTGVGLIVIGFILIGLIGAIRNPPE